MSNEHFASKNEPQSPDVEGGNKRQDWFERKANESNPTSNNLLGFKEKKEEYTKMNLTTIGE